jgi:AraC-like DNA-binding protein
MNTVPAGYIKVLFDYLLEKKQSKQFIQDKIGLKYEAIINQETRINFKYWYKLWEHAIFSIDDESFAIQLGQKVLSKYITIVGSVCETCPTLRESFKQIERFNRLTCSNISITVVESGENNECSKIVMNLYGIEKIEQHILEWYFTRYVVGMREKVRYRTDFISLKFKHQKPSYYDEYKAVFKLPMEFNCDANEIILKSSYLDKPLMTSQPFLLELFKKEAIALLDSIKSDSLFVDEVKELIVKNLYKGDADVESISHQLNISRQTLFRRLKKEGIVFKTLLNNVREEMAKKYLSEHKDFTVNEIAYLLGYSEPCAFNRAFKKWTGRTPSQFVQSNE